MPPGEVERLLLALATGGYLAACGAYWAALAMRRETLSRWASALAWVGLASQTASLGVRAYAAGHLPIYGAYEFSAAFAGGIVLAHLIVERRFPRLGLGVCVLPLALALLLYAWTLPMAVEPLIPIFRSAWLTVHIVAAAVAYSSFAATFGACCLYLAADVGAAKPAGGRRLGAGLLDAAAHRAATVGFFFLTVGIISGAIWAEYVWGRFWSWDPKETWSLVTWLTYAAYLHTRFSRGWQGRKAAIFGIVGFGLVLMTYIGVDFFNPRQHAFLLWQGGGR